MEITKIRTNLYNKSQFNSSMNYSSGGCSCSTSCSCSCSCSCCASISDNN